MVASAALGDLIVGGALIVLPMTASAMETEKYGVNSTDLIVALYGGGKPALNAYRSESVRTAGIKDHKIKTQRRKQNRPVDNPPRKVDLSCRSGSGHQPIILFVFRLVL